MRNGAGDLGMFDNEHRDGGHAACLERPRKSEYRKIYPASIPNAASSEDEQRWVSVEHVRFRLGEGKRAIWILELAQ